MIDEQFKAIVATIKIYDRANEFRIEIVGRFAGQCVDEVASAWTNALLESTPRTFMVDISRLASYDYAGCSLLREMYRHGMPFAAGTPLSLDFLKEISTPPARRGPAMVQEAPLTGRKKETEVTKRIRAIAAGQ